MQVDKINNVVLINKNLVSSSGLKVHIDKLDDFRVLKYVLVVEELRSVLEHVDIVLLCTRSFGSNFFHQLRLVISKWSNLPILVVAPGIAKDDQYELIKLGVRGIIEIEVTPLILKESLNCLINSGFYYPKSTLVDMLDNGRKPLDTTLISASFSDFQKIILKLLANGMSASNVARKLFRATRTIEWHKQKMMRLANVSSTVRLLLYAQAHGIISPYCNSPVEYSTDENLSSLGTPASIYSSLD